MDSGSAERPQLSRRLGLFDAAAINIGAIVGAGIFVVTGMAAGMAGSAVVVSIFVAAVVSLFTALSFAELTAWQPKEGSIYEYAYLLISPQAGFLVGWVWILSNLFTAAAVSLSFAHYLKSAWPGVPVGGTAAALCMVMAAVNFFGLRQSASLNNFIVSAKILILAFFVVFGSFHMKWDRFIPFRPFSLGVLYGAGFIFFAYGGFARVAIIADEIRDARRSVPRAILISLGISTAVYISVGVVAVGLAGAAGLAGSHSPLTRAISTAKSPVATSIVFFGAILATASVLLTAILGVSRMAYAMAKRSDLPDFLSRLDRKNKTPAGAIWITGVLASALALMVDISKVVAISAFALLFYYFFANIAALKLKSGARLYARFIPWMGAASCLALLIFILFSTPVAWLTGIAALAAGVIYRIAFNRHLSRTPSS